MGQVLSSIESQHPAYTVTPLVCSAVVGCAAYQARRWDPHPSSLITTVHLASLAFTVGSQIWHDFIASPAIYVAVPRHTFGQMQKTLFPRLFMLNTVMSSVTLSTFLIRHPLWEMGDHKTAVLGSLALGMLGSVVNGLFVTPVATKIQKEVHKVERKYELTDLKEKFANSEWVQIRTKFMKIHGVSICVNLLGLLGSTVYFYLLAQKVNDF